MTDRTTGDSPRTSNRRNVLKAIGAVGASGGGLAIGSRSGSADHVCDLNAVASQWDCDRGRSYVDPYYHAGLYVQYGTTFDYDDWQYHDCFRVTDVRTGRSDYDTVDYVSDLAEVEVYVDESYGVSDVDVTHAGASPGNHKKAWGWGSPESGGAVEQARERIDHRTDPSPRSHYWHLDRYERGATDISSGDVTGVLFDYVDGYDEVADHACQVQFQIRRDGIGESKYRVVDYGNHQNGGHLGGVLEVTANEDDLHLDFDTYAGRSC